MSSGTFSGARVDLHGLRRRFPHQWADFLRRHFRNSVEVAVFFSCDEKTARNWLEGLSAPSSPAAIYAVASIPGALDELMRAA